MVKLFYEAGIWMHTGMGGVALTWTEIKDWLHCTELQLSYWEIATIRAMSVAYVSEFNQASDKMREAPYTVEEIVVDEVEVGAKVADMLRSLKRK